MLENALSSIGALLTWTCASSWSSSHVSDAGVSVASESSTTRSPLV